MLTGTTGTWTQVETDGDQEIKQVSFDPANQRMIIGDDAKIYAINGNQMIIDDMITTGHARALLAIDDEEQQYLLATKIFDEKLSVRETEKLIKSLKNPKKQVKVVKTVENAFVYDDLAEKMKRVLGTKVSISPKGNGKGKIEIEYYSDDELERMFEMITSVQKGE